MSLLSLLLVSVTKALLHNAWRKGDLELSGRHLSRENGISPN